MTSVPEAALVALPPAAALVGVALVAEPALLLVVLLELAHAVAASSATPSAALILPAAGHRVTNDLPIVIIPCLARRLFAAPQ
jgi:hypothetical protein